MRHSYTRLLPVLLSLALLANGIGAAMASAHAACVHATAAAAPPAAAAPCHGDQPPPREDARTTLPGHAPSSEAPSADAPSPDAPGEDCDDACGCDCTAHGQPALVPPALLLHASARIAHAEAPAYARAAPALPHPVRPPIG